MYHAQAHPFNPQQPVVVPLKSRRSGRELGDTASSGKMKRAEKGAGELVVSRGDSAVDLQVTDHALDAVALAMHAPVAAAGGRVPLRDVGAETLR
jgi:hypothetical protein